MIRTAAEIAERLRRWQERKKVAPLSPNGPLKEEVSTEENGSANSSSIPDPLSNSVEQQDGDKSIETAIGRINGAATDGAIEQANDLATERAVADSGDGMVRLATGERAVEPASGRLVARAGAESGGRAAVGAGDAGAVQPLAGAIGRAGGHPGASSGDLASEPIGDLLREMVAEREARDRRRSDGAMPDEMWMLAQDIGRLAMMREICQRISGIGWAETQGAGRARVRRLERHLERLERRLAVEARRRV